MKIFTEDQSNKFNEREVGERGNQNVKIYKLLPNFYFHLQESRDHDMSINGSKMFYSPNSGMEERSISFDNMIR